MNIALGVLTCERPKGPTIHLAMASIGGPWIVPAVIWQDTVRAGQFKSWLCLAERILETHPEADAYFLMEDDIVFCRGLREYLDRWPADPATIALCSPFSTEQYMRPTVGWHLENRGWCLSSANSWLMPQATLIRILAEFGPMRQQPEALHNADCMVGLWAKEQGLDVWFHSPSLGHHIGIGNAATGDQGGERASGQNVHLPKTAEKLAEEYGVDEKTIRRDEAFAEAVDTIAEVAGPEAKIIRADERPEP